MNDERNIDPTLEELLSQHALQSLDADAEARVRSLLARDPALAREAGELERALEVLAASTQCPPPAHLRTRVLAAAQAVQSKAAIAPPADELSVARTRLRQPAQRRWPLFVSTSLAVAASFACAMLLLDRVDIQAERNQLVRETVRLQSKLDLETQAAGMLLEPNVVKSFQMGGSNNALTASGYVMLDLDARRASIAVHDLPDAPAGHSYHLWAVLENKNVACGRFSPAKNGRILQQFVIPVDSYTSPIQKLILTIEPDSDQAVPRGAMVMTS